MEIICRNLKKLLLNTCQDMPAYELPYIQSWPKILAPLHFFQIMHYFSQKMICKYQCFGILIFIDFESRVKKDKSDTFHTELQKFNGQNDWHLFKIIWSPGAGNIEITLATS